MPEDNQQDNGRNRRTFLKHTASALTALGLATQTTTASAGGEPPAPGTATVDNEQNQPINAEGVLTAVWERIDDETFEVQTRFKSTDLEERYGIPVLVYEPDQYYARTLPEEIRDGEQRRFQKRTTQVIGTTAEHAAAERKILRKADPASQISVASAEQPDWENDVPLYHYKTAEKAENMQSRKAPINVVFDWCSSEVVANDMKNGVHGGKWIQQLPLPKTNRYINDSGNVKSQNAHVMNSVGACPSTQFHMRLYDIGFQNAHAVGQAHKDPCNHNQGITIDEWKFALSRGNVVDWWSGYSTPVSTEVVDVGNNDPNWDTHDGKIGYIYADS